MLLVIFLYTLFRKKGKFGQFYLLLEKETKVNPSAEHEKILGR